MVDYNAFNQILDFNYIVIRRDLNLWERALSSYARSLLDSRAFVVVEFIERCMA